MNFSTHNWLSIYYKTRRFLYKFYFLIIYILALGIGSDSLAESPPIQDSQTQNLGLNRSFLNLDLGLSILGETGSREHFSKSFAIGFRGGKRWGNLGVFAHLEPAYWRVAKPDGSEEFKGAFNVGLGGELLSAQGLVRSSLSFGSSILTKGGELDQAGSKGIYFELRPAGLRWLIASDFIIGFDPIILTMMVPVLEGIPLIELEYRTVLIGEYVF